MPGIKTTGVRATPVNIPLEKPMWWIGGHYSGTSKTIIEIATAAYLHMSAPMPWITEPSQSLFRWQIGDVIEGGPFRQTDNTVAVPEGHGLGVMLDQDALSVWHKHLLDNGQLDHFHDPKQPAVYRRLPLH